MKVIKYILLLAIFGFSSGFDSTISFCDDKSITDLYLNLSNVGIKTLRKLFVSSELIKCLNLGSNELSRIDENAFVGLPELTALNLSDNAINFNDFVRLNKLPNLKTLILDKAFEAIDQSNYRQYSYNYNHYGNQITSTIRPIYRFDSPIMEINVEISFKLEKFSLSNYHTNELFNWLGKLDLPNLTHLRLNGNGIKNDDDLSRDITKNLTHLYLDDNEIGTFSGIKLLNLRYLSMNNNYIQKLCAIYCNENTMTPRTMTSLEYLSITGNKIAVIDPDAFVNSLELRSLNLSKNLIQNFPNRTFDNMTNLRDLWLNNNRLNRVPNICALVQLHQLSLDGNRIDSLNEESFCNLPKLSFVSLRRNSLTSVGIGTFGNLAKLTRLDISWNKIAWLPEDWIKSDIELEELHLDANNFNNIESMSLGKLKNLGRLSIARNPLRMVIIESLINLPLNTTLDFATVCEVNNVSGSEHNLLETTTQDDYSYG